MHTLLLLAALSNQITFTTTQQGDIYTVIPQVTLNDPASVRCKFSLCATASGDKAIHSKNKRYLYLLINRLSCLVLV